MTTFITVNYKRIEQKRAIHKPKNIDDNKNQADPRYDDTKEKIIKGQTF